MMAGHPEKTEFVPMEIPQSSMIAGLSRMNLSLMSSPEYHLQRLNERLREASSECAKHWWDALVCEFFEDSATLSVSALMEGKLEWFTIGRTSIPRYFQSFYDDGTIELFFVPRNSGTKFNWKTNSVSLTSQHATMITCYATPVLEKVYTHGYLTIDFTLNQVMRIRAWNFIIHEHSEVIPKLKPNSVSTGITRSGMTNSTINCLRQGAFKEPVRESASERGTSKSNARGYSRNFVVHKQVLEKPMEMINAMNRVPIQGKFTPVVSVATEPSIFRNFAKEDERAITRVENRFGQYSGVVETDRFENLLNSSPCITSPAVHLPHGGAMSLWQPVLQPPLFQQTAPQPGRSGQCILATIQPELIPPNPAMCDVQEHNALRLTNVEFPSLDFNESSEHWPWSL